jgi:hypothetical protein
MALFSNRLRISRFAAALVCSVVAATAGARADGNLKTTFLSTQFNPCNGEIPSGIVDVLFGVHVNEDGGVNVFRSFHGTLDGNQGNTYQISSVGNEHFDSTATSYDVPFHNNVVGLGKAPSFELDATVRIFVNADQEPIGFFFVFDPTFTCKNPG